MLAPIIFLSVLSIVLAVFVGLLIRKSLSLTETYEQINIEHRILAVQKDSLVAELHVLETAYESLLAVYGDDVADIAAYMEEIASLRSRILASTSQKSLIECQRQLAGMNVQFVELQQQLDALHAEKRALAIENVEIRASLNEMAARQESLEAEKQRMEDQIRAASMLSIFDVRITPLRETRKGETEAIRARRSDLVRICFSVHENIFARTGSHSIYIRLLKPDRSLFVPQGPMMARVGDMQIAVSLENAIDYRNKEEPYCVDIVSDEGFRKGEYVVELYSDQKALWQGTFMLK